MHQAPQKYENNPKLQEFLKCQFDLTAVDALMHDLVQFAFADWDAAIEAFEEHQGGKNNDS
jgi:hypothetical protein